MPCYVAYGLLVATDRPLPGLRETSGGGEPDLQIRLGYLPEWVAETDFFTFYTSTNRDASGTPILRAAEGRDPDGREVLLLRYADETAFVLDRAASRVWVRWTPPYTLEDAATYLTGPMFGLVLRLRGLPCLHASALLVGGRAVLLSGPGGAGKSTTAAALAARGFPVLAEDFVPLAVRGEQVWLWPGGAHIRLWPASAGALFGDDDALPRLTPNWEKRFLTLDAESNSRTEPVPVAAVYLFGPREEGADAPRVEPMPESEALIGLVSNGYASYLARRTERRQEFEAFAGLARAAPVRRLVPHADIGRLDALCDTLLADARAHAVAL